MGFQLPTSTGERRISEPSTVGRVFFSPYALTLGEEAETITFWKE